MTWRPLPSPPLLSTLTSLSLMLDFMFQQLLRPTYLRNFPLIFCCGFLWCPSSLGYGPYHLNLTNSRSPFVTRCGGPLLWKPSIHHHPPSRRLLLQPWALLYPEPLLPCLDYSYLLSKYLFCPTSSGFGLLKDKKCDIIFVLPIPPLQYHWSLCLIWGYAPKGCGLGLGRGWIVKMKRCRNGSCTWDRWVGGVFDS